MQINVGNGWFIRWIGRLESMLLVLLANLFLKAKGDGELEELGGGGGWEGREKEEEWLESENRTTTINVLYITYNYSGNQKFTLEEINKQEWLNNYKKMIKILKSDRYNLKFYSLDELFPSYTCAMFGKSYKQLSKKVFSQMRKCQSQGASQRRRLTEHILGAF
ncbi:hypothetical protein M0804_004869 [Polistes exclamans]|nr:hypothetical protein M0804_004869 [Polistes exclamans]